MSLRRASIEKWHERTWLLGLNRVLLCIFHWKWNIEREAGRSSRPLQKAT